MTSPGHFLLNNGAAAGLNPMHGQQHQGCGFIVSCLVKADNTSKDDVEFSSSLGFRLRKTIADPSQTTADIAKATVESSTRYMHAICKDLTGGSNCDVILSYGDGSTTKVMVRYDDKKDEEAVIGKLSLLVKIAENSMTSLVLAEGKKLVLILFRPPINILGIRISVSKFGPSFILFKYRSVVPIDSELLKFPSRDLHQPKYYFVGLLNS
jgi:hypothetical protein